jgi:hypothetical protein
MMGGPGSFFGVMLVVALGAVLLFIFAIPLAGFLADDIDKL